MTETDRPIHKAPQIPNAVTWEESFVQAHGSGANQQNTSAIFWKQFETIGDDILQKLNSNAQVTKADLAKEIQNGSITGDEPLVAAALYKGFDQIHSSVGRPGADKITPSDIAVVAQAGLSSQNAFNELDTLADWAVTQGNIRNFSSKGADFLTQSDISAAEKHSDLPTIDRAELKLLSDNFSSISAAGKIGKPEIDNYYKNFLNTNNNFRLGNFILQDMEYVSLSQHADSATHKLFGEQTDPVKSIHAESVHQRFAGNCAFEAALAGLAAVRPADIVPMILKTADGNFDVHLPGVKGDSFTVSAPTDAEIGLFSPTGTDGYWPAVLNKAYGEKVFADSSRSTQAQMVSQTADEWAATDGDQIRAIKSLTDHQVDASHISNLSDSQLTSKLLNGWNDHRVMVLNTLEDNHTGTRTAAGFLTSHALTITNVTNVDGQPVVTVRDPLSGETNHTEEMQMSLQTVRQNFDGIFIETSKPL
jgi:hypothetical protein